MRFLSYFFTVFGVLSFIFFLFSLKLIEGIVFPKIEATKDSYEGIVVLSGNTERVLTAARLHKSKNSEYILLSRENRLLENYAYDSESIPVYQYYIEILIRNGVDPEDILLFGDNKNTYDEISSLSELLRSKSSKILLITDRYHISRVQNIIRHFDLSNKVDFYAIEKNPSEKMTKRLLQNYILEYFKMLNFYLIQLNVDITRFN